MTQLNKGTYLPSGVLTHILSYCGDDFKTQHQKKMIKIINDFTELNKIHQNFMGDTHQNSYRDMMMGYSRICNPADEQGWEVGLLMDIMFGREYVSGHSFYQSNLQSIPRGFTVI